MKQLQGYQSLQDIFRSVFCKNSANISVILKPFVNDLPQGAGALEVGWMALHLQSQKFKLLYGAVGFALLPHMRPGVVEFIFGVFFVCVGKMFEPFGNINKSGQRDGTGGL